MLYNYIMDIRTGFFLMTIKFNNKTLLILQLISLYGLSTFLEKFMSVVLFSTRYNTSPSI